MSRHKNIRNLDLHAGQLRKGLAQVRKTLGTEIPVTDKEIQESLWYYYFDVSKTINYILSQHAPAENPKAKPQPQPSRKAQKGTSGISFSLSSYMAHEHVCASPRTNLPGCLPGIGQGHGSEKKTATELGFFRDCPWGNVPEHRRGEIIVERIHPRGGLLGGSGKMSKLAALAKARKEKAVAEKKQDGEEKASVSLLARLAPKAPARAPTPISKSSLPPTQESKQEIKQKTKQVIMPEPQPEAEPEKIAAASSQGLGHPEDPKTFFPILKDKSIYMPQFTSLLGSPSSFALSFFGERISTIKMNTTNQETFAISGAPTAAQAKAFSEPSPDDIVIAAQSGSKGLNNARKKTDKPVEKIEAAVQAMAIDNAPVKTRKKIDVLEEFKNAKTKESANFVVIGHVDAGKSTLMGRLLYDCGVIDERTIQKFKAEAEKIGKSSFHFAWVLDQTDEERSRGVTMDIATNHFSTASTNFTILDAPGHRDFVPNMIAGASQADFAVLVLDASTGAFESGFQNNGQTREHTLLARAIGISRIIVAVNKLDAVNWNHDRYIEITQQMSHFLSNAGFSSDSTSFVPCSGLTGANIVHDARDKMPWYNGPTLIQTLESSKPQSRGISSPLRITINDVFRGGIQNPVSISGRIEAGSLQVADTLLTLPSKESATVKGIEINEQSSEWAVAGHNVTLHLSGIDIIHLKPGDVMCSPESPIVPLSCFDLKILSLETITPMLVGIHRGRLNASGRVVSLLESIDKTTGKTLKKKPRHVSPGVIARIKVEVTLGAGIPVEKGNKLVLRLGGKTVAAGIVE
ncbi:hypothetical protein B9Z19DRAFT_494204 [Tuber borchii]|uniref:Elongation factor 1 alpha-like protein n=1 Tax=Tuber borchii TaxID=42251 RepID=A0A2T6ZEP2_TUBBO|nr:hypothetical protein B9Z19DRAFT_494204 [Tuber borchii]